MTKLTLELETLVPGKDVEKKWVARVSEYPFCDICCKEIKSVGYYCFKSERIFCSDKCEKSHLGKFYCLKGNPKEGHFHYKVHIIKE